MVLCLLEGVTGNSSIVCKYPQGFYPENKQRAFRIPQQGQHLGQDLFLWEMILSPGWALFLLSSIDGARGSFSLPQPARSSCHREGCWRCRRLEGLAGKGRREGKGFKMVHISMGYGITTVAGDRHRSSSRSVIERFFLLKQKFSQRLPELLGIFSPSAALP